MIKKIRKINKERNNKHDSWIDPNRMNTNIGIQIAKVAGRRGLLWLGIGVFAGSLLTFLDLGMATLLQQLLLLFGLSTESIKLPGGFEMPALTLSQFIPALIFVGIARSISLFLIAQSSSVMFEIIASRLRLMAIYETLKLKSGFHSLSDISTRLAESFPKATMFYQYLGFLLPNLIYLGALLIFMFLICPASTSLGLVGILLIGVIIHAINKVVRHYADALPEEYAHLNKTLVKVVKNFYLLKALRTTQSEYTKLTQSSIRYASHSIRASFFANAGAAAPQIFGIFLVAGLITRQLVTPEVSNTQFLSFLYLFFRFLNTLGAAAASFGVVNVHYPNFKRAASYFLGFKPNDRYRAIADAKSLSLSGRARITKAADARLNISGPSEFYRREKNPPEILVTNLTYKYPGTTSDVFTGLSFKIAPGSQTGIRGESGAGKSTLMGILLGVLELEEGNVTIDQMSLNDFFENPENHLGYVGPEAFLIEGSIRENLQYGTKHSKSDEECLAAMRTAQLGDWLASTKSGLDYCISEFGEGLSTGQKQRLALARALLNQPDLLILDEISANLDSRTESEIAEMLKSLKGQCTCLIVSHRDGILKYSDQIIQL